MVTGFIGSSQVMGPRIDEQVLRVFTIQGLGYRNSKVKD